MMTTVEVQRVYEARRRRSLITSDRYAGVRALWLKVIIRAVFDWVCYRDSTKFEKKKIADNAYSWLFGPSVLFNSFNSICVFLDISPDIIRRKANMMSKEQIAKIEHLERDGGNSYATRILLSDEEDAL